MQKYSITIEPPENKKSLMWSAFCKEWGFVTEDKTPQEALIGLLDAIRIAEGEKQEEKRIHFKKTEFSIPVLS